MYPRELLLLLLSSLAFRVLAVSELEQFDEQLTLKPLRDGRVSSRFSFVITQKNGSPRHTTQELHDEERMLGIISPA